ncbi:MAG: hypothetical protein K0U38_11420 [Epsilonproteobacteria bacterium]|nr:hypothetical protein [Campylobacterota bacterium]
MYLGVGGFSPEQEEFISEKNFLRVWLKPTIPKQNGMQELLGTVSFSYVTGMFGSELKPPFPREVKCSTPT